MSSLKSVRLALYHLLLIHNGNVWWNSPYTLLWLINFGYTHVCFDKMLGIIYLLLLECHFWWLCNQKNCSMIHDLLRKTLDTKKFHELVLFSALKLNMILTIRDSLWTSSALLFCKEMTKMLVWNWWRSKGPEPSAGLVLIGLLLSSNFDILETQMGTFNIFLFNLSNLRWPKCGKIL